MVLKEFFAKLGMDVDGASFAKADILLNGVKTGLLAIGTAAVAATTAIGGIVVSTAKAADKIDETAQALGITTDALQELTYAGSFSSLGMEDLSMGLGLLTKQMGNARDGSKEAVKAFQRVGVSAYDAATKKLRPVDDVLMDLADRFQGLSKDERLALALDLFGKSGRKMIPFLMAGRAGLAAFRKEAHDTGNVMSEEMIKEGVVLDDTLQALENSLTGLKFSIGGPLLKTVSDAAKKFLEWYKVNRLWIASNITAAIKKFLTWLWLTFKFIAATIRIVIRAVTLLGEGFEYLWRKLGTMNAALKVLILTSTALGWAMVFLGEKAVFAAIRFVAGWVAAAAPILVIVAVVAFLILLIDDVIVMLEGGSSVLGEFFDKWWENAEKWLTTTGDDPWWLVAIKGLLWFVTHLPEAFGEAFDAVANIVMDVVHWIEKQIDKVWAKVKQVKDYFAGDDGSTVQDKASKDHFASRKAAADAPPVDRRTAFFTQGGARGEFFRAAAKGEAATAGRMGSGGSPSASVTSKAAASPAPVSVSQSFDADINISMPEGASPEETAKAVRQEMEDFHQSRLEEAYSGVQ